MTILNLFIYLSIPSNSSRKLLFFLLPKIYFLSVEITSPLLLGHGTALAKNVFRFLSTVNLNLSNK